MLFTQDGIYSRTQAYNYLRILLGVPKDACINSDFFALFFQQSDEGFILKKPENDVERIFREHKIAEMNKEYFDAKELKNPNAVEISKRIMSVAREAMVA